jgi:peroxiredoxin
MMTMMKTALKPLVTRASVSTVTKTAMRSITIGTDMLSTVITLQKARPWSMNDTSSNLAADNTVTLQDLFAGRTVGVFGVPAPFTGTCSLEHYPSYKRAAADLRAAGIEEIVCVTVSDPYALDGWQQSLGNEEAQITFLADPDATFARAYGVDTEYDAVSLGLRSKRFSMIVTDGSVSTFRLVEDSKGDADAMLADMKELNENEVA